MKQNQYIPFILNVYQSYNLAIKWLIISAVLEIGNNFILALYKQIITSLFLNTGYIYLKQQQHYNLILKFRFNKYYRW